MVAHLYRYFGMPILILVLVVGHGITLGGAASKPAVTLQIPAAVLAKVINDALPLEISSGESLKGLWVESLEDLKLGDNQVSFAVNISGKDIKYTTRIGQQPIEVNVGNLRVPIMCDASLRYDRTQRILFVTPRITPNAGQEAAGTAQTVVTRLLSLANDHEYPLDLRDLKPIAARLNNQALMIHLEPADLFTAADVLHIHLIPRVTQER